MIKKLVTAGWLLGALPAWAGGYIHLKCDEFSAFGSDVKAQCGDTLLLRGRTLPSDPIEGLTVSYSDPSGQNGARFVLEFDRIDFSGDTDATLNVVAFNLARYGAGRDPAVSQGPARGSCKVMRAVESAGALQFACVVESSVASLGTLRLRYPVPTAYANSLLKDLREARFKLEAAAQDGQRPVYANAATIAAAPDSFPTEKNCRTEAQAKQAEAAAVAGREGADRLAGYCYAASAIYAGPDRDRLFAKSREWYERAIARGDSDAMVSYGLMSREVRVRGSWDAARNADVRPSEAELKRIQADSLALFTQAAERGNAKGQVQLCDYYALMAGAQIDKPKAVALCSKAADQGNADAMFRLSRFYERGDGVQADPQRGRQYLLRAADLGSTQALIDLARAYEIGAPSWNPPIERDIARSLEYYRKIGTMPQKVAELESAQGKLGAGVDATVFGIAVGFRLPSMSGCDFEEEQRRRQPREPAKNWCVDSLGTAMQKLFDGLGLARNAFADNGLRLVAVKINDETMDTSILLRPLGLSLPLYVAVDRDGIAHFVTAETAIVANEKVLSVLKAKYGSPSRIDNDDWLDPRTGKLVRRTPAYYWNLKGLTVEFHAQDAYNLTNTEAPRGRIDVYTPTFTKVLQQFRARDAATQPKKAGF